MTDGIDGSSLFELSIRDLKNFPDTGGINVDEHPAMSADARPPEILVDACDDPTVLDEAEPPAAGNRVPEGGDAAVADGDASEVVVWKPGTTGGQPDGRPDDWPSLPKRERRPPGRLQDYGPSCSVNMRRSLWTDEGRGRMRGI